jgi:Tfp pilus assembly protein PilN
MRDLNVLAWRDTLVADRERFVTLSGTGVGTLTCNPVTVANVLYQATPFQQSVTIPASMTPATATVVYH